MFCFNVSCGFSAATFARKWLVDYAEGKVKPGWTIINVLLPRILLPFSVRRLCHTSPLKWCKGTSHAKRLREDCHPRPSTTRSFLSRKCLSMRSDGGTCGRIWLCTLGSHASNEGKWTSSLRRRCASCLNMPALVIARFSFAPCWSPTRPFPFPPSYLHRSAHFPRGRYQVHPGSAWTRIGTNSAGSIWPSLTGDSQRGGATT